MRTTRWFPWFLGLAAIAGLIFVTLHLTEERAFITLVERAEPAWMMLALALQGATYLAQSRLWIAALSRANVGLPMAGAYTLSLAKLFVDQAIPSMGVSGNMLLVRALGARGISRGLAMSVVAVDTAGFYTAYAVGLAAALMLLAHVNEVTPLLLVAALALFVLSTLIVGAVLAISGKPANGAGSAPGRATLVKRAADLFREADPAIARNPRILLQGIVLHLVIVLLDATTLWALLTAVGAPARLDTVFAAFMVASLFRSMGVTPGGLGTFEASAVAALGFAGVPLAGALAATLLFRGLSFWLPMVPGLVVSRRLGH